MSSAAASIGTKGVPRAEREQQIVDAAVNEFAANGYGGGSMVAVAAAAGITKPLIYQYFGSKDGLYLACLRHVADRLLTQLEAAETGVDDTLASRIHPLAAMFEALEPQRQAWLLLFDTTAPADGEIAGAARGYRDRTTELAASGSASFLRARGIRSRSDASALSAVWMGLVHSLVGWWLDHPDESAERMTQRCVRLLAAVVTDPPDPDLPR